MPDAPSPAPPLFDLHPGELAPRFQAPSLGGNPNYAFDLIAGRHVVMMFVGSTRMAPSRAALQALMHRADLFDDERASFFGVISDPEDVAQGRVAPRLPGIRFFLDYDRALARRFNATPPDDADAYLPHFLLFDPQLRLIARYAPGEVEALIARLEAIDLAARAESFAPVLVVPGIVEPAMCRTLIDLYDRSNAEPSGFMREVDGKTVLLRDPAHKQRSDVTIEDEALRRQMMIRIQRRLVPMIAQAFQFSATRMERYLVACYDAEGGGHFRAHRDNTTKGTAHRRFAVTINLNAEDYEGGDLRFPEFGTRAYRAPTGGAVVFSCSLLHEVQPMRRGRRYAFLPFLYDDAAAAIRSANNEHLGEGVAHYGAAG